MLCLSYMINEFYVEFITTDLLKINKCNYLELYRTYLFYSSLMSKLPIEIEEKCHLKQLSKILLHKSYVDYALPPCATID